MSHLADWVKGLVPHLIELRLRLLIWAVVTILIGALCWWQKDLLMNFLTAPLREHLAQDQLIALALPEIFFAHLKVSIALALLVTLPFFLYQVWRFVLPGLYDHERRWAWLLLGVAPCLFYGGALFFWFVVWPVVLPFFVGFSTEQIELIPSISNYLDLVLRLLLAFGLAFQLPIALMILAKIGVLPSWRLRKGRRYAWLIAVLVAAVLTPPDPLSQLLLAGPLVVLYEVGILLAMLVRQR